MEKWLTQLQDSHPREQVHVTRVIGPIRAGEKKRPAKRMPSNTRNSERDQPHMLTSRTDKTEALIDKFSSFRLLRHRPRRRRLRRRRPRRHRTRRRRLRRRRRRRTIRRRSEQVAKSRKWIRQYRFFGELLSHIVSFDISSHLPGLLPEKRIQLIFILELRVFTCSLRIL